MFMFMFGELAYDFGVKHRINRTIAGHSCPVLFIAKNAIFSAKSDETKSVLVNQYIDP
jgi:uncharacterized protein YaiI (UPF0178 family)